MTKVASYQFLDRLRGARGYVRGILLYGPNSGLVDILSEDALVELLDSTQEGEKGHIRLGMDAVQGNGEVFLRELEHGSLFGGKRLITLRDGDDKLADFIEKHHVWSRQDVTCQLMVKGGQLGPRSRLRKMFESESNLFAVACYEDNGRTQKERLKKMLQKEGVKVSENGRDFILARLSTDSGYARSQVEKLILLAGKDKHLEDTDILLACENADSVRFDDLIDMSFSSNGPALVAAFREDHNADAGFDIALLRSSLYHVDRLHTLLRLLGEGRSFNEAVTFVKPRLFFKREPSVERQCSLWTANKLRMASGVLLESERSIKMGRGSFSRTMLEHTLLQVVNLASQR